VPDPYRNVSNPMITSTTHGPNDILPFAGKKRGGVGDTSFPERERERERLSHKYSRKNSKFELDAEIAA